MKIRASCDVPGCTDAPAIGVGAEQRCFRHALEKANGERRARGLPPLCVGDDTDVRLETVQ